MTLSSRAIAALAVLFVMLGVAVVAADSIGVNTSVFLPDQPTPTPVPPTPTPEPVASAENWVAVGVNQYQYAGDIDSTAQLTVSESALDNFIATNGLEAPAEDDPYPVLTLLTQIRNLFDEQIAEMQWNTSYTESTGPVVELFGGVPVTTLRYSVNPHTAIGGDVNGVDLFFAWFLRGEDELVQVEYQYNAAPDATIIADLRAWMDENIPELAQVDEETDTEAGSEPEADAESETDGDTETDAESDADASTAPDDETAPDAAPEADTEADADTEATPEAESDTESSAAPAEEPGTDAGSEADTEADAESSAAPDATSDAETDAAADIASGPWQMVQEGYYLHADEPNAFIGTGRTTLSELAAQVGYAPEDDADLTVENLIAFIAETNETELNAEDSQVQVIEAEGPATREIDGVVIHYIRYVLTAEGEAGTVSQISFQGLIDLDGENVSLMTFQYGYEDEPNQDISEQFDQWLVENIELLSAMD